MKYDHVTNKNDSNHSIFRDRQICGFVSVFSVSYLYVCHILLLLNCCELAVSVVVIVLLL